MDLNSLLKDMGLVDAFSASLAQLAPVDSEQNCGVCATGCETNCNPGCSSGCSGGNKGS